MSTDLDIRVATEVMGWPSVANHDGRRIQVGSIFRKGGHGIRGLRGHRRRGHLPRGD